ncbi:MAG: choice-of-anchor Q domain-containing protein [Pirellulaceae bacterium]
MWKQAKVPCRCMGKVVALHSLRFGRMQFKRDSRITLRWFSMRIIVVTGYLNGSSFSDATTNGTIQAIASHTDAIGISGIGPIACWKRRSTGISLLSGKRHFPARSTKSSITFADATYKSARCRCNTTLVDQRGVPRPQGNGNDLGAVEVVDETFIPMFTVNTLGRYRRW